MVATALDRETVKLTDLHQDSVASVIVDMRPSHGQAYPQPASRFQRRMTGRRSSGIRWNRLGTTSGAVTVRAK